MAKEMSGSAMSTTNIQSIEPGYYKHESNHTLHCDIVRQRQSIRLPTKEAQDHVNVLLAKRSREQV
jgi:hypothetical protein